MKESNLKKIEVLRDELLKSRKTMILTGAGISTDSGIPDFRSRGTGLWEKTDPMEFLTTDVLLNKPEKFYHHVYKENPKREYRPNKGHEILAELEERGLVDGIITQNIDNLHKRAGSKKIYEVHGNISYGYCLDCGQAITNEDMRNKVEAGEIPPRCDYCNGITRTSVVLFGDQLPEEFQDAIREVEESDLLIVIGSSLSVSPVNMLPGIARKTIIINREKTEMDYLADLFIKDDITSVLEELMAIL